MIGPPWARLGTGLASTCLAFLTSDSMARRLFERFGKPALVLAIALGVMAVVWLFRSVDWHLMDVAWRRVRQQPAGVFVVFGALGTAFSLRAVAWCAVSPSISFSQALAAIHVALLGNHVLPLRMGEPLRVVSAVRRSPITVRDATVSSVGLRAADTVALLLLGLVAAPSLMADRVGWWGAALGVAAVAAAVATFWLLHDEPNRAGVDAPRGTDSNAGLDRETVSNVHAGLNKFRQGLARPRTLTLVAAAWLAEATVVWMVARWFGAELSPADSVFVLAVAVSAQMLAVTPAGVGTYELAASSALGLVGVPLDVALAMAVMLHAVKTAYSLLVGVPALFVPDPGMFGRSRVPLNLPERALPQPNRPLENLPGRPRAADLAGAPAPIVMFLPARNEEARICSVIASVPSNVGGHRVLTIVIDDASTDQTAQRARGAGAIVVHHDRHRGLGAAVATGLFESVRLGAAAAAFCDADGEYDPSQLGDIVGPILSGDAHYVVGSRFAGQILSMRPHRKAGNRLLTLWVRYMTRLPVTDGQSGYRALSSDAARAAVVAHDYNYAQVLTLDLVMKGFGYREVPIRYRFRRTGRSFVRLGAYLRAVVPASYRVLNAASPVTAPGEIDLAELASAQRVPGAMTTPSISDRGYLERAATTAR